MPQEMEKPKEVSLELIVDSPDDIETGYVNSTRISRVQFDVVIDFGIFNVHELVSELKRLEEESPEGESPILTVKASGMKRIAMSPSTFLQFRRQVEEIYEAFEKQGVWELMRRGD